ncbi:hypothetical protein [Streptomyces sp. NPDC017991]|uniref:hypothetical protein n=1 Tax=Streptomyces sp. NPDC017991 TaxID=3365026 RepID=UPI0037B24D5C
MPENDRKYTYHPGESQNRGEIAPSPDSNAEPPRYSFVASETPPVPSAWDDNQEQQFLAVTNIPYALTTDVFRPSTVASDSHVPANPFADASNVSPTASEEEFNADMREAIERSKQDQGGLHHRESAAEFSRSTEASQTSVPSVLLQIMEMVDTMDRIIALDPREAASQSGQSEGDFNANIKGAIGLSLREQGNRYGEFSRSGQADRMSESPPQDDIESFIDMYRDREVDPPHNPFAASIAENLPAEQVRVTSHSAEGNTFNDQERRRMQQQQEKKNEKGKRRAF